MIVLTSLFNIILRYNHIVMLPFNFTLYGYCRSVLLFKRLEFHKKKGFCFIELVNTRTWQPTCPVAGFLSRPGPAPSNSALWRSHCHLADMGACGGTHLADPLRRFQRTFQGTFRTGDDYPAVTRTYQSSGTRWLWASTYEKPGKEPKPTGTAILSALWPWWQPYL